MGKVACGKLLRTENESCPGYIYPIRHNSLQFIYISPPTLCYTSLIGNLVGGRDIDDSFEPFRICSWYPGNFQDTDKPKQSYLL